jgi:PIN domain nuclease of toxin-antitoxin system
VETGIFVDTHVLIWLYAGEVDRLTDKVKDLLRNASLLVSPMTFLEMDYLQEVGRFHAKGWRVFSDLEEKLELELAQDPFIEVVREASRLSWTRDPFDRLIVAQASLHKAPLISKDETVRRHYSRTVWR